MHYYTGPIDSCKTDWFNNKENYIGGIHRILLVLKQKNKISHSVLNI